MPTTILPIELALPSPPTRDLIGDRSWFLRSCATFPDRIVLAFGAPGTRKDESLGRLFPQLRPMRGGEFEIELAAILAERLPSPRESPEYAIRVAQTRAIDGLYSVSNVMQVVRYRRNNVDRHAICQAVATPQFLEQHQDDFSGSPHIEYLPAVVTARYVLTGRDAEEALSENLESIVDDFIAGINRVVAAHVVSIDTKQLGILNPVYDRGSFPWVYMLIRGDEGQLDAHRIATSLLRTTLVPHPYEEDRWQSFQAYAGGDREIDVAVQALRTAESYIQAGAYDFALLLAAIAAELVTTRYVHQRLHEEAVSKKRLKEIEKDLTFSIMLSTHLVALAPAARKPSPELIGRIDKIRKRRNDLMHKGKFAIPRTEIVSMVNDVETYIDFIGSLREN